MSREKGKKMTLGWVYSKGSALEAFDGRTCAVGRRGSLFDLGNRVQGAILEENDGTIESRRVIKRRAREATR